MTTYERLQRILLCEYNIEPEKLSPTATLDDLGIDSLGLMELLFKIEDEFHIAVPTDQVELTKVEDVVNYIDRLALEQATPLPSAEAAS